MTEAIPRASMDVTIGPSSADGGAAPGSAKTESASASSPSLGIAYRGTSLQIARRLYGYAKAHKTLIGLGWVATVFYGLSNAALVYMIKPIFDEVLIETVRFGEVATAIVALYALKGLGAYFATTLLSEAGQKAVFDLRRDIYAHILDQSFGFFAKRTTGSLMSHITTDVERIQTAFSEIAADLLKEGLTVIGLVVLLLFLDWRLAIIALVLMPLAFAPLIRLGRRLRSSNESSMRRWKDIANILQETISGFRVVKAFGMEAFEKARFEKALERLQGVTLRMTRTTAFLPPLMEAVGGVSVVVVLWYGTWAISRGYMTAGSFTAFLAGLFALYTPVKRLSKVNAALQGALAAGQRAFALLDTHFEIKDEPTARTLPPFKDVIEYHNVSFHYDKTSGPVLSGASLKARRGEVVAIVGMSGSGKTSLLNLLPRFYNVTAGSITVDGIDIRDVTLESLRRQIGLVKQETILFNDTVRANIAYGLSGVEGSVVESAARAAFAHDFILDLPRRYDTVIGERGSRLSGGQKQRIAIARAILKDPPILILDEATSALDTESESLVQQALFNLMKGRTTLVVAHRLATVRRADRILVLEKGEIREEGAHDELLARNGIYARLHDLQFRSDPAV
ncbi:MAG: ABC transporter ATP-binding protein [Vicinamibacteria bacterium]|nr:ABC transporter ATP-binding protein [Vicinamibacteria bacterium]